MDRLTKRNKLGTPCSNNASRWRILKRLAEYEDAEESGLLVRLPCRVGDTGWFVWSFMNRIIRGRVTQIWTHRAPYWIHFMPTDEPDIGELYAVDIYNSEEAARKAMEDDIVAEIEKKINAINALDVVDWSSSCGELEYVIADPVIRNFEILYQAGFTEEEIEDSTDEDCLDLTTLVASFTNEFEWHPDAGFKIVQKEAAL